MRKRRLSLVKNLSIPARLRISGAFAIAVVLAIFYAGYSGLNESNSGLVSSITATTAVLSTMDGDMMHDALRADVLNAIINGPEADAATKLQIAAAVDEHADRFLRDIQKVRALPLQADVLALIDKILPLNKTYADDAIATTATALRDRAEGRAALPGFLDKFVQLETEMGKLDVLIVEVGNSAGQSAIDRNATMLSIIIYASALAVAILVVSNVLISRSITKPLTRMRDAMKAVADGNLDTHLFNFNRMSDLKDEVSEIAEHLERLRTRLREAVALEAAILRTQQEQEAVVEALSVGLGYLSTGNLSQSINTPFPPQYETLRSNFNASIERLNQTITQVVRASASIRTQSDEIADATGDLARRTENQAATLEETAAALDQLTALIRAAANSAQQVETIVQNARHEAEDSGKVVLGAVDAMTGIEKSAEKISQIIGVIDDIAFQTNLLALNAGVEAARAGDAGRGFAVVASEVRALAQRSSEASKEIKILIRSSSQFVERGVHAVGSAGAALTKLVDRVSHISTLVSEIALGAQEQSVGLGEVNIGVNQLDQVAQQNAAMVEKSKLDTQALRDEVVGLDGLISHFTTKVEAVRMAGVQPRPRQMGSMRQAG